MHVHGYTNDEYDVGDNNVTLISKLDVSSPLHLHPNGYVALTVVSVKLKGIENYQVWSYAMLLALEGKNKIGFIDGVCKRSNTDEVLGRQWDRVKCSVKMFLMGLGDTYMQIRSSIPSRETLPEVRSAYDTIYSKESYRVFASGSSFRTSQRSQTSAFVSNAPNKGSFQRNQTSSNVHRPNVTLRPNNANNNRQGGGYGLLNNSCESNSFLEASKHTHWTDAMNTEMEALLRNDTWEITDFPKERNVIGNKWVYRIKYESDGEIERYKARLVANGFNQRECIDYEETFSPVVKMVTIRCLLPLAPRQWNAKLAFALTENGFSQSKSDYSLYTKNVKGMFVTLLVYVDDIIIIGNSIVKIEKLKEFLKTKFMIKDLGKLKHFIGIEVIDTKEGICFNQRKYFLDLLYEFGMLACKPYDVPLPSKLVISNEPTNDDPLIDNIIEYQKLMGKLIYLTNTRPAISYVVHCLSQFMHSSLFSHSKIAFKILRYLKGSTGMGIHITKDSCMSLYAYSDAGWAKCVVTRKSVTGYCVFLCGALVF
ncbi:ribonuclease H-like domain-containing protein [Tanacetum coccineum]